MPTPAKPRYAEFQVLFREGGQLYINMFFRAAGSFQVDPPIIAGRLDSWAMQVGSLPDPTDKAACERLLGWGELLPLDEVTR